MFNVIGENYLILAGGAMIAFMAVLAFVSVTDRDPTER